MAFRQLQKLLRPSSRVLISGKLLLECGKLRFHHVVFFRILLRHLLITVLWDSAEGVVLIEFIQHLVNLFKARRDLWDTLLLFLGLVGLLHGKVLFTKASNSARLLIE